MNKQVLSIEQMQNLKELGLDTSKASMCWRRIIRNWKGESKIGRWSLSFNQPIISSNFEAYEDIPAFTLPDILELLPKEICTNEITIYHHRNYWCIYYYGFYSVENKSLIDAAYEMLCCLVENGDVK